MPNATLNSSLITPLKSAVTINHTQRLPPNNLQPMRVIMAITAMFIHFFIFAPFFCFICGFLEVRELKFQQFLSLMNPTFFYMRLSHRIGRFRFRGINGVALRICKVSAPNTTSCGVWRFCALRLAAHLAYPSKERQYLCLCNEITDSDRRNTMPIVADE